MARFVLAVAGTLLMTPVPASAQQLLTLEQVVDAALAQNPSLRAAGAVLDEAQARTDEARAGFYPRLSVTESWQRGTQPVFVFSSLLGARQFTAANFAIDALNHPAAVGFFRTSVGVEQLVFDGGRQRAAVSSSRLNAEIAGHARTEAEARMALAAAQAFGALLMAQATQRAAEGGLVNAREDLGHAERRRDAGVVTNADVLAMAVHVADLEQRVIQARGDARTTQAALNRLMGAPVDRAFRAADPRVDESPSAVEGAALAALVTEAEQARPEMARARAAVQLAEAAERQARAGFLPRVSGQGAFELAGTSVADRASSWIAGVEARWTFSTGGAELASRRAARHAATRASALLDEVRASVQTEIVTALAEVETARARERVARAAVGAARESQRIIRDRFEAGLAPVDEVLRASTTMLDAEAREAATRVATVTAHAQLAHALGRRR